jgi:uncharacterized protein YecT (DUF1311 family)
MNQAIEQMRETRVCETRVRETRVRIYHLLANSSCDTYLNSQYRGMPSRKQAQPNTLNLLPLKQRWWLRSAYLPKKAMKAQ